MQEAWAIHGVYSGFDWTPDGQSIVIWAKGKIRRVDVESGEAEVIPFRIRDHRTASEVVRHKVPVGQDRFDVKMLRQVAVSPRGDEVAYQALGYIYVRSLPDGHPRRMTEQTEHFEFYPRYSRDGSHLVYTTWNDLSLGSIRVASTDRTKNDNWVVTDTPGHYIRPGVFSRRFVDRFRATWRRTYSFAALVARARYLSDADSRRQAKKDRCQRVPSTLWRVG